MTGHDHGGAAAAAYCIRCGTPLATVERRGRALRRCPSCGWTAFADPKVGVGALVVDDDRVLLVRRGVEPGLGRWSVPAGYLDAGEDPAVAVAREVVEETGMTVTVGALLDTVVNPPGLGASLFLLYAATVTGGRLTAGDDATEAGWFAPDRLPDLADLPATARAIARVRLPDVG